MLLKIQSWICIKWFRDQWLERRGEKRGGGQSGGSTLSGCRGPGEQGSRGALGALLVTVFLGGKRGEGDTVGGKA